MSDKVVNLKVRADGEEAVDVHGYEALRVNIAGQVWHVDGGNAPLEAYITIDPVKRTITMTVPGG